MAYTDYLDDVQELFIGYYLRPADPAGLIYWAQQIDDAGGDSSAVVDQFATSSESQELWGDIDSDTIGSVIDEIYQGLFNRAPEAEGKDFYVEGFNNGDFTPGTIVLDVLNGAKSSAGTDLEVLENKVAYANAFVDVLDPDGDGENLQADYSGQDDADIARDLVAAVTEDTTIDEDTIESEIIDSGIPDAGDPLAPAEGQTYTLSEEIDTISGTTGDDVVIGDGATASPADTLDMGSGNDTVRLYQTTDVPTLNSVEAAEFVNLTDQSINTANSTSLETVMLKNSQLETDAGNNVTLANGELLTLQNVDTDEDGNTEGINLSTTNAEETIVLNDVAGREDAQELDIDLTDSAEDVTTLTLQGDTNSSVVTLRDGDDKLETLNLTGDAKVEATNSATADITSLTTIDASENTAGVEVTYGAEADFTFTGSAANDILFASDNFDANDSADAGEGTDIAAFSQSGSISGDLDLTNFEAVWVASNIASSRTIDLDNVEGLETVYVSYLGSTTGRTHTLQDIATTATTINFTGEGEDANQDFAGINMDWDSTSEIDAVTVNISNDGTEAKAVTVEEINVTNALDVTINASDVGTESDEGLTINQALDVSDAESLTITSNAAIDMSSNGVTGSDALEAIDASDADGVDFGTVSALAGDATITLSDGNDSFTGSTDTATDAVVLEAGAGADFIALGQGANEITTGDGADTVQFATASDSGNEITDFTTGSGGDIIDFSSNEASDGTTTTDFTTTDFATVGVSGSGTTPGGGFNVVYDNSGSDNTAASLSDSDVATYLADVDGAGNGFAFNEGDEVVYLAVSDGSNTGIFKADATGNGDTAVDAGDLTNIVQLTGVSDPTDIAASNFADFL